MSAWRREAIARFPELRNVVEHAESSMGLWIDLQFTFRHAFESGDLSLSDRIVRFAAWCYRQTSGGSPNDLVTAVACAFYEHLPTDRRYWPHFRRWFSQQEFEGLMTTFLYHSDQKELDKLRKVYADSVA